MIIICIFYFIFIMINIYYEPLYNKRIFYFDQTFHQETQLYQWIIGDIITLESPLFELNNLDINKFKIICHNHITPSAIVPGVFPFYFYIAIVPKTDNQGIYADFETTNILLQSYYKIIILGTTEQTYINYEVYTIQSDEKLIFQVMYNTPRLDYHQFYTWISYDYN